MNPIQTDPNPKNDSITEPPEMTPVTRFSHSSQEKKRSDNRRKAARYMQELHRRNTVGDMLYMVGFWVEYVFVCVGRRVGAVVRGIGDTVLNLLLIVLRPILIGIITLIEDLTSPFVRMASGIRHIRAIPDTLVESEDGDVRRAKKKYLASGIRKYSIVVILFQFFPHFINAILIFFYAAADLQHPVISQETFDFSRNHWYCIRRKFHII